MAQLLTQNQIAEKSILDINGRQTYLGNAFVSGLPVQPVGFTAETPIFLVSNPAGNTKSFFTFLRRFEIIVTNNQTCTFRFYTNPVITNAGTLQAPRNMRTSSASPQSTMVTSTFPTVSSFGDPGIRISVATAGASVEDNVLNIGDPGASYLLTATSSNATSPIGFQIFWYEI